MNPAPKYATSIRRRLLIFLLPPLILVTLAGIYVDYRVAMISAQRAHDRRLADAALALAAQVRVDGGAISAQIAQRPEATPGGGEGSLSYSIVGPAGQVLAGTALPLPTQPGKSNPAYADVTLGGHKVRVVSYQLALDAGPVIITVAGADDARSDLARFALGSTFLTRFIQLDITLLLVWIGVYFGLEPLRAVRRQIEARSARDLLPLDVAGVSTEVRPMANALNQLFELLRESVRSQRQFVADTAHQLRTPIAGLLGHLELLMREPAAEPIRSRLVALHEGMSRLAHSANQLLALASAEPPANLADRFQRIELHSLVKRVVELNVERSVESGIDLGAEASPVSISGSARLLEDLLGNLVDNALNYTQAGGSVTVRSGMSAGGPYLEVEDDGPGIPEPERMRVRQRFYRLPGASGRGCGLGLAIVDEIARTHAAALSIDAGAGGFGTRVRVQFPETATDLSV
jgi:two-component system sensor histidine kinase TctE